MESLVNFSLFVWRQHTGRMAIPSAPADSCLFNTSSKLTGKKPLELDHQDFAILTADVDSA